MLTVEKPQAGSHEWQIKEQIKQHLFRRGVDQNKTTVLIIDEGQKIPAFCLEILREFLNYETNEYKLLQIVIFAQNEFENKIRKYANFADRISLYHTLKPLSFYDTRLMIKYRLEKSSNSRRKLNLFTYPGLWAIYRFTGGYPRKIINLCHQSILSMIIQNRSKSGYFLVSRCAHRVFPEESRLKRTIRTGALTAGAAAVILLILLPSSRLKMLPSQGIQNIKSLFSQNRDEISGVQRPKAEVSTFRAQIASTDFYKQTRTGSDSRSLPPAVAGEPVKNGKSITFGISEKGGKAIAAEEKKTVAVAAVEGSYDADSKSTSVPGYSTILGQIAVQRYENLSEIIKGVYGGFKTSYLESVIKANPDIKDPDRVEVGQIISLPTILVDVKPGDGPVWWIKVKETDALEPAFNIVRNHTDGINPMRLIPYWTPENGTKFAVVLNKLFNSEQSARRRLEQLPAELASNSMILSLWNRETVYFADPYSGRNH
jgi:general secretion pathway protein A